MLILHDIDQNYIQQIKDIVPDWDVVLDSDRSIWPDHIQESEVIVGWTNEIGTKIFHQPTKLKWVQSWSAGVNTFPVDDFSSREIKLTSAKGVHAYPISETIIGFMLTFTRNLHTYIKNQTKKIWSDSISMKEIHEKTVGIIGVGEIGKETAKIAKAFGMTVLGVRHSGKDEEYVDKMYSSNQLHNMLPLCDYVVVTLPLTKDTYHLFSDKEFKLMKPSSFFINIGRGQTVVEDDLIKALINGEIAGAGLDVFETEPLSQESPLWELDNVIITPHNSGLTDYYTKRVIENIFIPNLKQYIQSKALSINLVDYSKGY